MNPRKAIALLLIGARAQRAAARLSLDLVKASGPEKEAIRAGIEMEQWLAQSCRDCLGEPEKV
jgi:hypothetical protein